MSVKIKFKKMGNKYPPIAVDSITALNINTTKGFVLELWIGGTFIPISYDSGESLLEAYEKIENLVNNETIEI